MTAEVRIIAIFLTLAGLLATLTGSYFKGHSDGVDQDRQRSDGVIKQLKLDAAQVLAEQTGLTLKAERELGEFKTNQEKIDAEHKQTVDDLRRRLRDAAGPSGRLRDPNQEAAGCGGGGGGTQGAAAAGSADRPGDGAEAGGLLSKPLTELLDELTLEADSINNAYASCKAQTAKDRAQ